MAESDERVALDMSGREARALERAARRALSDRRPLESSGEAYREECRALERLVAALERRTRT